MKSGFERAGHTRTGRAPARRIAARRIVYRREGAIAALALASAACGDRPEGARALELGSAAQPIIGGLVASNPLLDHTGTLRYRVRSSGASDALCSASLIAPQTVVTANHCTFMMATFERFGIDVFWTPGPDFTQPLDEIPIVAVASAPGDEPGFAGYGRDVAVAHLERPSDGLPLLGIQPFRRDLLGVSMVTLGYGISSAAGAIDGLRRVGRETVSQIEGSAYAGLFGDFESFVELVVTGQSTELDILPIVEANPELADLAALRAEFDAAVLVSDYEVVAGKASGDTQSCELDSGGPLALVDENGDWQSFGVVSAGPRLARPICAFGQVFAVFGPETIAFLEAERAWDDPCGEVSAAGRCDGTRLERCESSFATNVRRRVNSDCSASGSVCVESSEGASCAAAPFSARAAADSP
jgi:hypothetical protein